MKLKSKLFYGYVLALLIYSGFTLIPAPAKATLLRYHVDSLGLRLIYLTIIILLALIWWAAFYGYAKLREYAELIKNDKDGQSVARLAQGVFLVVMWLPVSSVVSSILGFADLKHPSLLAAVTIVDNYISLAIPLAGFILIGYGARGLSRLARLRPSFGAPNFLALLLIYVGLIYYKLMITTPERNLVYHLPVWLLLTTLAAPYIFMWFTGLVAAYELYRYQHKVAGVVYRKSWDLLSLGLAWLIVTSIIFQYVTTLSAHLQRLSIYAILVIVYCLLLILSIGFILIALGSRKLKRIEEV